MQETRFPYENGAAPRVRDGSSEEATVLLVEDDPVLRSTLAYALTREGFRVLVAGTGEAGLDLARKELSRLDVVVLDVMLPGMSGLQVLRALRKESHIPILMLSARGEEQDRIDGLELGADDYVIKPFALRELVARVKAGVRRSAAPAAQPPTSLLRGSIRIEIDRHRVLVGGAEIGLRPKEFGLLVTLAMEPGRVFGRQELLDANWGEDVIVDERTVDVHVSWLRGKLADAGVAGAAIRTVYGVGYQLVLEHDEDVASDPGAVA